MFSPHIFLLLLHLLLILSPSPPDLDLSFIFIYLFAFLSASLFSITHPGVGIRLHLWLSSWPKDTGLTRSPWLRQNEYTQHHRRPEADYVIVTSWNHTGWPSVQAVSAAAVTVKGGHHHRCPQQQTHPNSCFSLSYFLLSIHLFQCLPHFVHMHSNMWTVKPYCYYPSQEVN